jgi:hypothetical protein
MRGSGGRNNQSSDSSFACWLAASARAESCSDLAGGLASVESSAAALDSGNFDSAAGAPVETRASMALAIRSKSASPRS